ncbi:DUF4260 domain-containing protein [Polaribacter sp. MSW13]|uniref:DUF4260 domain-containing protein n=1 Tax=Polaribacter marinus TaxID=2916838 RepID=A0A9X2AIX4_9FLAO|nr:DUF4260 domain-containing protein [Polaribacter marinus]MCI2228956.1 DUF4260 domain-containing protein [Polaribacter marinus]
MKILLKIEELMMLILSIVMFSQLSFDWWWYLVLFLSPDVSFIGYTINPKFGAICYNLLHHKGLAIMIYLVGMYLNNESIQLVGIIIFGHASFDRILGYGLKYSDSFNNTHLGKIGSKD